MNDAKVENYIEEVNTLYGRITYFRHDLHLGRSLKEYGEWAHTELEFLKGIISEGATVVDAGAFIGTHTMAFSKFVGSQGKVLAFEPHPISFRLLQRNTISNSLINVDIFNEGLSDESEVMQVSDLNLASPQSLGSVRLGHADNPGVLCSVNVQALDNFNLESCNLIKADVEGMEIKVLRGSIKTIEQHQPYVYTECNSADESWPVVLLMRSLGYQIYLFSTEAYNPNNFRGNKNNIFDAARELGLVCVPPHLKRNFSRHLDDHFEVIPIVRLDDLVHGLLKKPQYKQEVLAQTSGGALWGNDFWRNEGELKTITKHQKLLDERAASLHDEQIVSLNQAIENLNSEISRLNHVLSCMYSSTSWRITEPLRKLRRLASVVKGPHLIGGPVFNVARGIFRRLPLSNSVKDKLRFLVLARSRIFTGYRPSSSFGHRPIPGNISEIAEECTGYSKYVQFKHRLAKQLVIGQSGRMPRRAPLLSFDGKDLRRIASSISFELSPDPEVSVVIPVYGNASLTLECLVSIQNSTVAASYEIVLADDASKDRTPELLELVSGIKVHRNAENKGFLRNCNAALLLATGEYVVYLNNDVQVTDGWLDDLLEVFSGYANAGAVGPKIVYPFGHLQEAGVALKSDGNADMVGLNDNPYAARYEYTRPVDYCSGACLMVRRKLLLELGGFSDEFAPAYCEDADLCLRIIERGYKIYYTPRAKVFHHLSKTTAADGMSNKLRQVSTNVVKLHNKWAKKLDELAAVKIIAFYLPQFHPIPENDLWWGEGFTEWTNVKKAQPNFVGHNQPKVPADLGYYDLRDEDVMVAQAALARKYGIDGFCFYYYWFGGSRLLDMPIERMLQTGRPNFPYCLCWANENWSRRWDGRDSEILIGQQHSPEDDRAVILDLIRHFKAPNYIRIDGRPHLIVYRVDLFPDFFATSKLWREICREQGVGEIYISMVESHDLVHKDIHPSTFGCNASIEFPPLNMAERISPSGEIMNPDFHGGIGDYRDTALRYCARALPSYTRFRGVMPGWDNTARRQNDGFCFEHSGPEVFQAWLEHTIRQTRQQHHGDEQIVFINAWNEWAEGAYLEPDTCHGHAFLEAVKNAKDAERLLNADMESHTC